MRIAMVAPLYEAVPPRAYGGTERVVSCLTDELVARGHDVTLFAAGGSQTAARLEAVVPEALRLTMSASEMNYVAPHLHLHMLADVLGHRSEFDIVHAHTEVWTLPFMSVCDTPSLLTLHGRLDGELPQRILPLYPSAPLVSISDAQRRPVQEAGLNWAGTCYNGLDLDAYFAAPSVRGDYLAFVGRINPEKRPDWAVEVALRSGLPLRVAAKVDPLDVPYWDEVIKPLFLRHDVDFIGEIDEEHKPDFFAGALATVFPIDWPEPFGLIMAESMAAGTPVLALANGSVPEVLTHGVSGAIGHDLDDLVDAAEWIGELSPDAIRQEARRFTAAAMTDRYLQVYENVISPSEPQVIELPSSPGAELRGVGDHRDRIA